MTVPFSLGRAADGAETIVLFGAQGVRTVPDTHVNYHTIKGMLLFQEPGAPGEVGNVTEDEVYALADAAATVTATLTRLSERVTLKGDHIYFDGDEVENKLTKHIVDMIRTGDDNYGGYVLFLENLASNPSKSGRKGLFRFLERNGLVITESGCFIGYKGVNSEGKSVHAGSEDVTVHAPDGTTEVHKGHIPNAPGTTVEMARSLVDPDRSTACSVGLHVGTHSYAQGWSSGGQFLTVEVNPRDVVEVPDDSNGDKLRACRYTVVEVNGNKTQYTGTSFIVPDEVTEDQDYEDYYDWDDDPTYGSF
jgi:hypothetical protein